MNKLKNYLEDPSYKIDLCISIISGIIFYLIIGFYIIPMRSMYEIENITWLVSPISIFTVIGILAFFATKNKSTYWTLVITPIIVTIYYFVQSIGYITQVSIFNTLTSVSTYTMLTYFIAFLIRGFYRYWKEK